LPPTGGASYVGFVKTLLDQIEAARSAGEASTASLASFLAALLEKLGCVVGTLHRLNPESQMLELVVQQGLPDSLLATVATIPIGKGMAGLAAERREPVQVCNLQTGTSGDARPGAKATGMEGSIATPIIVAGELRGTLGVAKPIAYEFSSEEIRDLKAIACALADLI